MDRKYRYFKVLLSCSCLGMDDSLESTRYFATIDNASTGTRRSEVKKKRTKTGTIRVEEISYSDYCAGLITQVLQSYLEKPENTIEPLYAKYFSN